MKHEELDFERRCRAYARQQGWVAWKNEKNGHKGIPDDSFLSADGSRFLLVEFKKDTRQKARPEQELWLRKFPRTAYLIGDFETFKNLIDNDQ